MAHLLERPVRMGVALALQLLLATALLLAGCGDPFEAAPQACAPGEAARGGGGCERRKPCAPGELTLESGECQRAGLPPDMQCPPGELALPNGGCQPAGVPPDACGAGFVPDGDDGCEPLLPAEPCLRGQMAVPGEMICREVAPCGDGPWGSIPVEASAQFVDQAYAGGDSDGTAARPWTRVQDGVDAAEDGAIVAVTDGTYVEDVLIQGKAVRLWGRCPGRVEIKGPEAGLGAITILTSFADGTEINSIAVTGAERGIVISGVSDVVIDAVWIHDAAGRGLAVDDGYGPTSVAVRGTLVEQNHEVGVFVKGSRVEVEAVAIRSTQAVNGSGGIGIGVIDDSSTNERADVSIRSCLLEQNQVAGVLVGGSDVEIEAAVIRSTQPADGDGGWGIALSNDRFTGERAVASVRGCVVDQNHRVGIYVVSADAEIEGTVVRSTRPVGDEFLEGGILIDNDPVTGDRADVSIRSCLVAQNHDAGLLVRASDVEIEGAAIRATQPLDGNNGWGVGIRDDPDTGERADVRILSSLVEQNHELGVFIVGSDAEIEGTLIRSTQPLNGRHGRGIHIQDEPETGERAQVSIRACLLEQNHDVGLFVAGAGAEIEGTVVRSTQPVNGDFGWGIGIQDHPLTGQRGDATIRASLVEQNHGVGVLVSSSRAEIEAAVVRDTQGIYGHGGQGIVIQASPSTTNRADASVRSCLVEQNRQAGLAVAISDARIEATTVRDTRANEDGRFGDGITIENGTATIQASDVTGNARAGIANWGSDVQVMSTMIVCNTIDVNGEALNDIRESFDGSSDWYCSRSGAESCADPAACTVERSHLEPPPRLDLVDP